jgi:hypothetical protein
MSGCGRRASDVDLGCRFGRDRNETKRSQQLMHFVVFVTKFVTISS